MPERRLAVLDGWRGISILLVLAAHLLPLGPKAWQLNVAAGILGMVLFFVLSGFLVTRALLAADTLRAFLVHRAFRILPLAWGALLVALAWQGAPSSSWLAHLLFYANLPAATLTPLTAHFWSLCVEMQFYLGIALLAALAGRRGLRLVLPLCLGCTALRILADAPYSILTPYRIDEILAGCLLALAGRPDSPLAALWPWLRRIPPLPVLLALLCASHPEAGALNYLRPYLGAALVGITLAQPRHPFSLRLGARVLAYVAATSYALYVLHPLLAATWLGDGGLLEKYAKRPLLLLALFGLAHLSTFHFERRWIAVGKRLAGRVGGVSLARRESGAEMRRETP